MTELLLSSSARPNDSFFRFQLRRLATGAVWSVFGLGGLAMTVTYFPWLNFTEKDQEVRITRARRFISRSFNLFFKFAQAIGVMNVNIKDVHELQKVRGAIIIANHPTILDYVLIASQLPELDCLVKADLSRNFFLKGPVKAADYMLNDASAALIEECRRRLAEGHNILIFPEGTRTVPGKPLKLQRGVAHIALRCGCDLEVIKIGCSDRWLDKSSKWYEIPPTKPTLSAERQTTVKTAEFLNPSEESYSLAARRLTKYISELLSSQSQNSNKNESARK